MEEKHREITGAESVASLLARARQRDQNEELEITGPGGTFRGLLFTPPKLGTGLIFYRLHEGDVLRTSPVVDISSGADGSMVVQTLNSTYRLARLAAVNEAA